VIGGRIFRTIEGVLDHIYYNVRSPHVDFPPSTLRISRRVRYRRDRDDRAAGPDHRSPYLRDDTAGAGTTGAILPGPISGRRPPRPTALIEYMLDRTVKGCDPRV
jgi:hypothetical protein